MIKYILLFLFICTQCNAETVKFSWNHKQMIINAHNGKIDVSLNGCNILQLTASDISFEKSVFVADFNFDHYPDIAVLRDAGIELYYDVYIFNPNTGKYEINQLISSLACPEADAQKETVKGVCFHASACQNWKETYKYSNEKLILIKREGLECDPATGLSYQYNETYKNGEMMKRQSTIIE